MLGEVKIMSFKDELNQNKEKFYEIFDKNVNKNGDFITAGGSISYDKLIEIHLNFWVATRINGVSVSMVLYAEDLNAIKLIDELAKSYFT